MRNFLKRFKTAWEIAGYNSCLAFCGHGEVEVCIVYALSDQSLSIGSVTLLGTGEKNAITVYSSLRNTDDETFPIEPCVVPETLACEGNR